MLATQLLDHLRAAGVRLDLRNGSLRAGPSAALTPGVRGLIAEHRPALVDLLSRPAPTADTAPRRLWLVTHLDGRSVSHSFTPGATLTEVRGWYPDALSIEPEDARPGPLERDTRPAEAPAVPAPTNRLPAAVACATCLHLLPDQVGDGSGLGTCQADAPASRQAGSCWPGSTPRCTAMGRAIDAIEYKTVMENEQ